MIRAGNGSCVTVSYIGTLENGRIFHSTEENGALTFTIGAGEVFPALERAIMGMREGDVKNITICADEAYGPRRQENLLRVSRTSFPVEKEIAAGQKLSIEFKGGTSRVMLVVEAGAEVITLDGNHPLAGCDLTFALRLDEIVPSGQ